MPDFRICMDLFQMLFQRLIGFFLNTIYISIKWIVKSKSTLPLISLFKLFKLFLYIYYSTYLFLQGNKVSLLPSIMCLAFRFSEAIWIGIQILFCTIVCILVRIYNVNFTPSGKYHITIHVHFVISLSSSIKNLVVIFKNEIKYFWTGNTWVWCKIQSECVHTGKQTKQTAHRC